MKVILDTNIFCADYRMGGGAFRVFVEGMPRIGAECCVPEVVVDEVLANHQRSLADAQLKITSVSKTWQQLCGRPLPRISDEALAAAVQEYSTYFVDKLRDARMKLLPYPETPHRDLVRRALQRRKPFNETGSGYRDSLIWQSIVQVLDGDPVNACFVTNNSNDFGKAPTLHPDLKAELESRGCSLTIYNTLERFNAEMIIPRLEHLENIQQRIGAGQFDHFDLKRWLETNLLDTLNFNDFAYEFVGLEVGHGSVRIRTLERVDRFGVDDVRLLPSGDMLISANADLGVEVVVSADLDDCVKYQDVRDLLDGDCSGHPTFWSKERGNVAFTLSLKKDVLEVDWFEIDEVRSSYGEISVNPHPRRDAET